MLDFLRSLRAQSRLIDALYKHLREPYYRALELAYPKGIRISLPSGDRFRIYPRFLGMKLSNYEPGLVERFCSLISDGMTVIDVGAHVGIYSLVASAKVGSSGKVVAIEPSPANARLLRQHLSVNQCRNVEVIEAAVADKPSQIIFNYRPNPTDPGSFANSIAYDISGEDADVQVRTLDDICSNLAPAIIKIDRPRGSRAARVAWRQRNSNETPADCYRRRAPRTDADAWNCARAAHELHEQTGLYGSDDARTGYRRAGLPRSDLSTYQYPLP